MTEFIYANENIVHAKRTNQQRHPLLRVKVKLCYTATQVWEGSGINWKQVWRQHWWPGLVDGTKIVAPLSGWHTKEDAEKLVKSFQEQLDD